MKHNWKLKQDIVAGVLPNTGGKPNILFKKGDIITGEETKIFIANKNIVGVQAKPTVAGARIETATGLHFIPSESLEKVGAEKKDNNKLVILISLAVAAAAIGYFWKKPQK